MRIHYLQHVPFEDLAQISLWAQLRHHSITGSRLFESPVFPESDQFDALIILGGPMNIYEEDRYSWLKAEKTFIARAIEENKRTLGICLGAQLIADVLGSKVMANPHKEIGWFPVQLLEENVMDSIMQDLPAQFMAFHWHGDTFDLPSDCRLLAQSEGCQNQAFDYEKGQVTGLQFHLEVTQESIRRLAKNCESDIDKGPFTQSKEIMLNSFQFVPKIERLNEYVLKRFLNQR